MIDSSLIKLAQATDSDHEFAFHQNKGIGTHILKGILDSADERRRPVRLSHLKNNPVSSLYRRFGFVVTGETGYVLHLARSVGGG